MKLTSLTPEEKLLIFPDAYVEDGNVLLSGIRSIGEKIIDILEASFFDGSGNSLDVFPGAHRLYHLVSRNQDTNDVESIKEDDEIGIPSIIMSALTPQAATLGQLNQTEWISLGEFEPGVKRSVNFPIRRTFNLTCDVFVIRDNILDSMQDIPIWETLWMRYQFLPVNGLHYRTRMINQMSPLTTNSFANLSVLRGSVEIQRVTVVDPNFVEETSVINEVCLKVDSMGSEL